MTVGFCTGILRLLGSLAFLRDFLILVAIMWVLMTFQPLAILFIGYFGVIGFWGFLAACLTPPCIIIYLRERRGKAGEFDDRKSDVDMKQAFEKYLQLPGVRGQVKREE